ncbi:unnamed protein product [Rotaria sordida]|uniref:Uncharacterized protein n=1 Tax=Rotaria sordida TaxID=392033 RepID=A0A813V938_9BILA|nr:unnamed protein product [Rotaria sordida]CAF0834136.1 unnamed protein product [Rotaria sordida]
MSSISQNIDVKGKKKHLALRSLILIWHEKKCWGYRKITKKIWQDYQPDGISYNGLLSLSKRTIKRGTLEDKVRPGRPKAARTVTNIEQIKQRHLHQKHNPGQRSTAVNLGISLASVHRAMKKDLHIKPFHKFKTSKMTNDHVKSRVKSAKTLLNKYGRKEDTKKFSWHLVINSDYSAKIGLQVPNNTKNNVVYGETRESIPRELLEAPTANFFKGFMMWSAISWRGLIPKNDPIFIDEFLDEYEWRHGEKKTMTAQRYIDLLKQNIIPSIEERYMDYDYIYQDDYDSIHRGKITLDFIEENMPSRIMPEDQASKLAYKT